MNFPKTKLTQTALDALLEVAYEQKTLTFTKVVLGSGNAPNSNWEKVTAMGTSIKTLGITAITVADHMARIRCSMNNATLASAFYLREIGVFAKVDDGAEFLYAYTNSGADALLVKPYDADNAVEIVFEVVVTVGNAETVNAIINSAIGYVTTDEFQAFKDGDFNDHITNYQNPHKVTKAQVGLGNVVNAAPNNLTITFTTPKSLATVASGSKLTNFIGMLDRAIRELTSHLLDTNNPHNTTYEQVGAAAKSHTHSVADISGTLPVSKGGTGVTSTEAVKRAFALSRTYALNTLDPSGWSGGAYDLETLYNSSAYDIEIELANTATAAQKRAYSRAAIVGDSAGNILHATGAVPQISIPILIKIMEKV